MAEQKTILVTAASGNIGQALVPHLLSSQPSPKLVLPTRSTSKLQSTIPALVSSKDNVIIEEGTVRDPVWFQSLLSTHNVDTVFLCLTGVDELYTGLLCLDAITRVPSVTQLIYVSVLGDIQSDEGFKESVSTRPYPHMFAKVVMEQRLRLANLSLDWTILGPGFFFSNDVRDKPALLNGAFNTPILSGRGARIAPEDIALAARNALLASPDRYSHKKIMLGSRHGYTGAEVMDIWSKAFGKEIKGEFVSEDSLEAWEQRMRGFMPGDDGKSMVRNLRIMFSSLEGRDVVMSDKEYAEQVELLGREPTSYEDWVEKTVEDWLTSFK